MSRCSLLVLVNQWSVAMHVSQTCVIQAVAGMPSREALSAWGCASALVQGEVSAGREGNGMELRQGHWHLNRFCLQMRPPHLPNTKILQAKMLVCFCLRA
jgi:hypothetical protein